MSDELVKVTGQVPEFLRKQAQPQGFEDMTNADVVLPRLSICQAMTPQRKKTHTSYIENLKDGDLFNSVSGVIYGPTIEVIPLLFKKTRIFFRSLVEGGGILCQSFNGVDGGILAKTCAECPNSHFDMGGKAPACNLFYNYPAILPPSGELIVVSLKSSALKVGRNWNSRMKMLGCASIFSAVYQIKVIEQTNSKGTFFIPSVTFLRFVGENEFKLAQGIYENIRGKAIVADDTGLAAEVEENDQGVPF